MRIDNPTPAGPILPSTTANHNRIGKRRAEDQVQISAAFDNSKKIERLAAAVNAGTYYASSWKIAASVIKEMLVSHP